MNFPTFFTKHPDAYFADPGSINFIPAWVILLVVIITFALLRPKIFAHKNTLISPLLLAFILGSLMPVFDDLLTYLFGPPFAHHSLFHSVITGPLITYTLFLLIGNRLLAKYAVVGNLTHTLFNFTFDVVALFFPLTYQEFGLTNIIFVSTYWIKALGYPVILILLFYSITRFFRSFK